MKTLALILLATLAYCQPASRIVEDQGTATTRSLNHKAMGLSFPPVSSAAEISTTIAHCKTLGVKSVRFSENWKLREPTENVWNWGGLDYRLDSLKNASIKVFLTVESDGPAWRCGVKNARSCVYNDLNVFRTYVDTLVRRYKGKIAHIQFGNESFSPYWYAGTAGDFINSTNAFYAAVKAADPTLPVVLSGMQISAIHTLAVCSAGRTIPSRNGAGTIVSTAAWCADTTNQGMLSRIDLITAGAKYDLLDLHLYDNVEYWYDYLEVLRAKLPGKTFLASEIGAPSKRYEPLDDAYHAARVGRILSMVPLLTLQETYYFKLLEYPAAQDAEHEKSGLIGLPEMDLKPAYDSLRIYNIGAQ